jgi:hypothetical protein
MPHRVETLVAVEDDVAGLVVVEGRLVTAFRP